MRKFYLAIVLCLFSMILLVRCNHSSSVEPEQTAGPCIDADGHEYSTVKIGDQFWMAENLKVTHYRNGDAIAEIGDDSEWRTADSGALCSYENNTGHDEIYGKLYNGFAVTDSRGIAPDGWHVPTDAEWKTLEVNLGMNITSADSSGFRGLDEGGKLKSTDSTYWQAPNAGATDACGFRALPGGVRSYADGQFFMMGQWAYFWTGTKTENARMASRRLGYLTEQIVRADDFNKRYGLSVRCVQD